MSYTPLKFGEEVKKAFFRFEEGFTYLNHCAGGKVPNPIREKQKRLQDISNDNPDMFYRVTRKVWLTDAIKAASEFLGADPTNLVLVENATAGLNTVLKAFPWNKEDIILATSHIYNAIENACKKVTETSAGGYIKFDINFPIKDEDEVIRNMALALDENPKIKLALLDHITTTGLILPIKKMIEECRRRGVLVLVDGAMAPGQLEINLEEIGADFYVGVFHKFLYTPRGSAFLWVHKDHQSWCTPLVTSHLYNMGFQMEYRFVGPCDDTSYFVIPDAIQFYKDIGGINKVMEYTEKLLEDGCRIIAEEIQAKLPQVPKTMKAPGIRIIELPEFGYPKTWMGSLSMQNDLMNSHRINCSVCHLHGKLYLRISANIYNESSDYQKLANLLAQLLKKYREN